ncbi:hypothetical protein JG687_00009211 [Phytophthora cactorum]|uniref:Uncharacterized protein n=1 Tax=Phytophthora cactorum TaxID=29920 RepID=A0A329RVY9_9STRA|nr:hypothetical protein Pcac1_g20320 [Phytophthora cactorum]KAG2812917.1 hypothetical protein PC112_g14967 [Phytophthora cactorum]KAG2815307.1 hypothetical protein PC111_g13621 [Phytophthora cactorum]KAG2852281.1 hypothetical protein PC113_g15163 [Phytophthora cactorum]KAG2892814.1 hypothetical protein PC114_g16494 [Phytophthora cactorum]
MTQQDSESKPKKRQVWVQWMDERTHDTFATTGIDLVTLTDDAEVLADVAETAHTLYNEKQPEGQNLPAHVLQSQLSLYEDEDANFANKDKLDLLEDIGVR